MPVFTNPEDQEVYGYNKKDTERISQSVLLTESLLHGKNDYRRHRHTRGSGKGKYNGFFKIIDDSADPSQAPYKVKVIWGEFPDNTNVAGHCLINSVYEVVAQLDSNSTFSTNGFVYLKWQWSGGLLTPTLEHEEVAIASPLTYETGYLKWPLAWVDVSGDSISITQTWLGGFFQASLWGEC